MSAHRFASTSYVDDDPRAAAREAAAELRRQLGGPPDWVVVFFSSEMAPEAVVAGLYEVLPAAVKLVGCSSYAEIDSSEALTRSVSLLGGRSPALEVMTVALLPEGRPSFAVGQALGAQLAAFAPSLVVMLPDILTVNATQLLRGVQSVLGSGFPIVGGAAADGGRFERTYQLCGQAIQHSGVVALALKGPLRIATAARSGYTPVSLPRTASRIENGNVLLELDGRPALDVYREFLGPRAGEIPAVSIEFPLGVIPSGHEEAPALTRAIFAVDEARRALVLGGDLPERGQVRILSATRREVLAGARAATELALQALPQPDFALVFSCLSRKVALGLQYKDECAGALALLPASVPTAGFYTFGELSPRDGISEHHESTFTLVLVQVAADSGGP